MTMELENLVKVVNVYKQSLLDVINRTDVVINSKFRELQTRPPSSLEKFNLSMQMVKVMEHYLKIFHSTLELSNEVTTNITFPNFQNIFLSGHDHHIFDPQPEEMMDKTEPEKDIKQENDLKVGDTCVFTSIESLTKFYLKSPHTDLIDRFHDEVNKVEKTLKNNYRTKRETRSKMNKLCCGFVPTHQKWFRLQILDWMSDDDDEIFVQLIDTGEEFFCHFTDLKFLPQSFVMFPQLATRCRLLGIEDSHSLEYFKEFTGDNEFVLTHVEKDEMGLMVDLKKIGEDITLSELFFNNSESPYSAPEIPSIDETIEILITAHVDTCHFYVHILRNKSLNKTYDEDFDNLYELMQMVTQNYETIKTRPKLNQAVIVKENDEYFRGNCVEYLPCGEIEIYLVDFGFYVTKNLNELFLMKDEFLELPFQAIECVLYNCRENNDADDTLSRNFFDNCMHMQNFNARVMAKELPLSVLVWNSDSTDLRYEMEECNLAHLADGP